MNIYIKQEDTMSQSKKLVNLIRELVRAEVKNALNEIFINEGIKSISQNVSNKPKPKEQSFTKDPAINKILNETAHQQETEEYPTMGGGTYDTSKMSELLGYGNMLGDAESRRKASAVQTAQTVGADTSDPAVQNVMSAMTKDYRGVMSALKKKDGKI